MTDYTPSPQPDPFFAARPAPLPRPQRSRLRRGCLWMVVGGLLALVLPVFLLGTGLLLYLIFPPAPQNILILGVDARTGEGFVTRTDSIMVLGVQPAGLDVSLLSIPRDLYVDTPGDGMQRINAVNVLGEMDTPGQGGVLVQQTIAANFGIETAHYVRINFEAFTDLIDALGGIEIDVPSLLIDYEYPTADGGTTTIRFEQGTQHMTGEQALAYARTRHADDDYRRADRQQQVLIATADAMLNPANWGRLPAAGAAFWGAVDTDMNVLDMAIIAPSVLLDAAAGAVDRMVITREWIVRSPEGYAVPDYAALDSWLRAHFD